MTRRVRICCLRLEGRWFESKDEQCYVIIRPVSQVFNPQLLPRRFDHPAFSETYDALDKSNRKINNQFSRKPSFPENCPLLIGPVCCRTDVVMVTCHIDMKPRCWKKLYDAQPIISGGGCVSRRVEQSGGTPAPLLHLQGWARSGRLGGGWSGFSFILGTLLG